MSSDKVNHIGLLRKWGLSKDGIAYSEDIRQVLDHSSGIKLYDDRKAVMTEPYGLGMREMKELVNFCEEHGLDFSIDGESTHFPGRTFRVLIFEREVIE